MFPRRRLGISTTLPHRSSLLWAVLPLTLLSFACVTLSCRLRTVMPHPHCGPLNTWPTFVHVLRLDLCTTPLRYHVSVQTCCPEGPPCPSCRQRPPSSPPGALSDASPCFVSLGAWPSRRAPGFLTVYGWIVGPSLEYLHQEDRDLVCFTPAPDVPKTVGT